MRSRGLEMMLAMVVGCGAPSSPSATPRPPPPCAAPPISLQESTADAAPCSFETGSTGVDLYLSKDDASPIARTDYWRKVLFRFSDPTPVGRQQGPRSRVELAPNGFLRFGGWASLRGVDLATRRRIDVAGRHAWLRAGAVVNVLGARDRGVLVGPGGQCSEAENFELVVGCEDLVDPAQAPVPWSVPEPSRGVRVWPTAGFIDLMAEPEEAECSMVRVEPLTTPMFALEWRGGFVHLVGGVDLRFDGWAPAHQVSKTEPMRDRDSCCGPPDSQDVCPAELRVVKRGESPVEVRAGNAPESAVVIGLIEPGANVEIADRKNGYVAVLPPDRHIVPTGGQFWIPEGALEDGGSMVGDGCR